MIQKVIIFIIVILIGFVGYVATRDGKFHYSRSGVINASPDQIFPYISNFKLGEQWSPYEKADSTMKKTYTGLDGQVGSTMKFEGNSSSGSGQLEILRIVPNEAVDIRLTMIKPFSGENFVQYKLSPAAGGTQFTWTMSGDSGFMGKFMTTVIDCEKMIGDQFSSGIANLKSVVEAKK